jgi:thiamine biosynthesis lipoprotein ApbE
MRLQIKELIMRLKPRTPEYIDEITNMVSSFGLSQIQQLNYVMYIGDEKIYIDLSAIAKDHIVKYLFKCIYTHGVGVGTCKIQTQFKTLMGIPIDEDYE